MVDYVTAKCEWSLVVGRHEGVVDYNDDVIPDLFQHVHRSLNVYHTEEGVSRRFYPHHLEEGREGGREGGREVSTCI